MRQDGRCHSAADRMMPRIAPCAHPVSRHLLPVEEEERRGPAGVSASGGGGGGQPASGSGGGGGGGGSSVPGLLSPLRMVSVEMGAAWKRARAGVAWSSAAEPRAGSGCEAGRSPPRCAPFAAGQAAPPRRVPAACSSLRCSAACRSSSISWWNRPCAGPRGCSRAMPAVMGNASQCGSAQL